MRYWIGAEDEGYDREFRRATAAGDALPEKLSPAARGTIGVMVAVHAIALLGMVCLIFDWLRG
jgi:hypothetical protein